LPDASVSDRASDATIFFTSVGQLPTYISLFDVHLQCLLPRQRRWPPLRHQGQRILSQLFAKATFGPDSSNCPEILQQYIILNANDSSPIDHINEEFVKESKLLGNGYSTEDKFVGQVSAKR
jgi:hypothetical protein